MGDLRYYGAFHGAEVPFVFEDTFELKSPAERRLSKEMGCYWTNFAATGDPNEGSCIIALHLPRWPAFNGGDALELSVGRLRTRAKLKQDACDLFSSSRGSASVP